MRSGFTQEEVEQRRRARLELVLEGTIVSSATAFGALRFVPEEFWKKAHKGRYDSRSTRSAHPGCSLGTSARNTLSASLYVLHGTSNKSANAVCVSNIDREGRKTYFGSLPAAPMGLKYWRNSCEHCNKLRLDANEEAEMRAKYKLPRMEREIHD